MDEPENAAVDPEDFMRAILGISAEDAETVRRRAPGTREAGRHRQEEPSADDGDEDG